MRVTTVDAKNNLSALIEEVSRGVEVTITRRGIPVAKLVSATPSFDKVKARQNADGLLDASRGARLGGVTIKELVEDGRD